jgi:hypothetical protein
MQAALLQCGLDQWYTEVAWDRNLYLPHGSVEPETCLLIDSVPKLKIQALGL